VRNAMPTTPSAKATLPVELLGKFRTVELLKWNR